MLNKRKTFKILILLIVGIISVFVFILLKPKYFSNKETTPNNPSENISKNINIKKVEITEEGFNEEEIEVKREESFAIINSSNKTIIIESTMFYNDEEKEREMKPGSAISLSIPSEKAIPELKKVYFWLKERPNQRLDIKVK